MWMIHARVSKKKILKIIEVLEELPILVKKSDGQGRLITAIGNSKNDLKYKQILNKLRNGLLNKKYELSKDESRNMVIGLDLYNINRTDNVNIKWDYDVEKLYHEFKKRFAEVYHETVYDDE